MAQNITNPNEAYERCVIQFQMPSAIIWQIKFILNNVQSKKSIATATTELLNLSEMYGRDFDRYLLQELLEQVDIKEIGLSGKAAKEKTDAVKMTLLLQELNRASQKPEFLSLFYDIVSRLYAHEFEKGKQIELIQDMIKKLKLNAQLQILIILSILESDASGIEDQKEESTLTSELIKIFRQKLIEFHVNGKPEQLPEYAVHRILFLFDYLPELMYDPQLREPKQLLLETVSNRYGAFTPLRSSVFQDISQMNCHQELLSNMILNDGGGLEHLCQVQSLLEPWELLVDIGHNSSYMYDFLLKTLSEFKGADEKTIAKTILMLAYHHSGKDDHISKITYNAFESNKDGTSASIKKEPEDKKTLMSWSLDNLSRAFRELYSNLNWLKVFESFGHLEDNDLEVMQQGLDTNQFLFLIQLYNKCKPQNIPFPLQSLFSQQWQSGNLQLNFIKNCIALYVQKKEKIIQFQKLKNKLVSPPELEIDVKNEQTELIEIWSSVDLVERLVLLSEQSNLYQKVRRIFEVPLTKVQEHLLLSIAMIRPKTGNIILDELLSLLLPTFLGDHQNSTIVLQTLFQLNSNLFIRGVCELCKHDQRLMNLSRVLDITQEVRESLIPIVYCEDFEFAVSLGILAGKRDFLHYDVWIKNRLKDIGTPFIDALLKYLNEYVIAPLTELISQNQKIQNQEALEAQKSAVLEKSHLSKEKLLLTVEHLQSQTVRQNEKVSKDCLTRINMTAGIINEYFPQHYEPGQNSEEIDTAANEHFQRVFSAEENEVDSRIEELIETMQKFKNSTETKEQEIYACMLHGLFDEYRFLHRYPQPFLMKIAKLFGAIIRNNLLDQILQDIALKFVIEAVRREGRRQKFGIIVIRSFIDRLQEFPQFLKDIYQIRQSISQTDLQLMLDIERIHQELFNPHSPDLSLSTQSKTRINSTKSPDTQLGNNEEQKLQKSQNSSFSVSQSEQKSQQFKEKGKGLPLQKDKQPNTTIPTTSLNSSINTRTAQANTRKQNTILPQVKPQTPPIMVPRKDFIPSNRLIQPNNNKVGQFNKPSTSPFDNQIIQAQDFVPTKFPTVGLNIDSAEFMRPMSASNMNANAQTYEPSSQTIAGQEININSREFQPTRQSNLTNTNIIQSQSQFFSRPTQILPHQIKELVNLQKAVEEKIKKARESSTKLRLDDLLDDESINLANEYIEDQLRIICNNTGKGNFRQKIEELKKFLIKKTNRFLSDGTPEYDDKCINAEENLRWFIHYILAKRIGAQSVGIQAIYVEMLRELNSTVPRNSRNLTVIGQTLSQVSYIFKKCMVIDEEEFKLVTNAAQGSMAIIKGYLASLGSFVGSLSIAKNEGIRAQQLDLKQILVECSQTKNSRLAVTFVCRILKECQNSRLFSNRNPWILSLLQILREIYDLSQAMLIQIQNGVLSLPQNQSNRQVTLQETVLEIESLFKSMSIHQFKEIEPHGMLSILHNTQSFYVNQFIRRELDYVYRKSRMILPAQTLLQDNNNMQRSLQSGNTSAGIEQQSTYLKHQMSQINQAVKISQELLQVFARFYGSNEQDIREMVGSAVDNSIVEILLPVVDRSVTIALITTRELVLKDFAHDGDYAKMLKAADLIVQNLAGSLALVTCREPLRLSLTTNLKTILDIYFKKNLNLKIINSTNSQNLANSREGAQSTESSEINKIEQINGQFLDSNGFQTQISEEQINEIAVLASRENLELGCRLIKKEVIEKALKRVREDPAVIQAVERRKRSEQLGIKVFRDDTIGSQFQELPQQLQPNFNGLTPSQFQVYADFAKLDQFANELDIDIDSQLPSKNDGNSGSESTLSSILNQIEQQGLNEQLKVQVLEKINGMNQQQSSPQDHELLWTFVQKNLEVICKNYDCNQPEKIYNLVEALSTIIQAYKVEDLSKRLLTQVFLQLDVKIFNDVNLNILLMKKNIIAISEWDNQLSIFFKESAAQLSQPELQFFADFLETSIIVERIIKPEQVPQLLSVITKMSSDPKIGVFCTNILEKIGSNKNDDQSKKLKELYLRWVVTSYLDNREEQEILMNKLFAELEASEVVSKPSVLFQFCQVMVETSIEKALVFGDSGENRPADRLDFRYIDSFVKLVVVLLLNFNLNKHEFMHKVLQFIGQLLDQDHSVNKAKFNQRPYYRMLMNILTAVNHSGCFNQKTQLLVLFSMADLFQRLTPQAYPAFCFAWLELISHKFFLPHFLKQADGQNNSANNHLTAPSDATYLQKRFKMKELIVSMLTFLRDNMNPGENVPPAIQAFYHASLRVIAMMKQDFPDFLSDFHFNFVNSMPEQSIQLRNIVLSAYPSHIQQPDPFCKTLKIDLLEEIRQSPRILSDYNNYLTFMDLREDLENYTRTRNPRLIQEICTKMKNCEEITNGKRRLNSKVISAVVLFIANWKTTQMPETQREEQREARDIFRQIVQNLDDTTRLQFLNSIINELRYPNNHTFYFSCVILYIYAEADREVIYEQISAIFLERLQTQGPYPWGLMISFRELIQIPKFQFMRRSYIRQHPGAIIRLFQGQLRNFLDFVPTNMRLQMIEYQQSNGKPGNQ